MELNNDINDTIRSNTAQPDPNPFEALPDLAVQTVWNFLNHEHKQAARLACRALSQVPHQVAQKLVAVLTARQLQQLANMDGPGSRRRPTSKARGSTSSRRRSKSSDKRSTICGSRRAVGTGDNLAAGSQLVAFSQPLLQRYPFVQKLTVVAALGSPHLQAALGRSENVISLSVSDIVEWKSISAATISTLAQSMPNVSQLELKGLPEDGNMLLLFGSLSSLDIRKCFRHYREAEMLQQLWRALTHMPQLQHLALHELNSEDLSDDSVSQAMDALVSLATFELKVLVKDWQVVPRHLQRIAAKVTDLEISVAGIDAAVNLGPVNPAAINQAAINQAAVDELGPVECDFPRLERMSAMRRVPTQLVCQILARAPNLQHARVTPRQIADTIALLKACKEVPHVSMRLEEGGLAGFPTLFAMRADKGRLNNLKALEMAGADVRPGSWVYEWLDKVKSHPLFNQVMVTSFVQEVRVSCHDQSVSNLDSLRKVAESGFVNVIEVPESVNNLGAAKAILQEMLAWPVDTSVKHVFWPAMAPHLVDWINDELEDAGRPRFVVCDSTSNYVFCKVPSLVHPTP